jgi:hypothetical protein
LAMPFLFCYSLRGLVCLLRWNIFFCRRERFKSMEMTSGVMTFWILTPIFIAVGIHLILYSRRRKKMLALFAKKHQLNIRPEREKELQGVLDTCFSSEDTEMLRTFGQLSSLVEGESIFLFRTVEVLDIKPHIQSYDTHFARIVALFDVSADYDDFFLLDKSLRAMKRRPGSKDLDPKIIEISKQVTASCEGRHTLSITLRRGKGLIYF